MASFKKKLLARIATNEIRSSVGFIVDGGSDDEDQLRVELNPFDQEESVITVMDETGNVIIQDNQDFESGSNRLEYRVSDLESGTYFFEVKDRFFHQVKEVHISQND